MKTLATLLIISIISTAPNAKEEKLQKFITSHVEKIKPMEKETNLAYWDAANSGKAEDYEKVSKLTLELRQVYSDPCNFAFLKETKKSGQVKSALLARQLADTVRSELGS